jgi:hypothetical protein
MNDGSIHESTTAVMRVEEEEICHGRIFWRKKKPVTYLVEILRKSLDRVSLLVEIILCRFFKSLRSSVEKMNTLARAGKEALKQLGNRGFASSGSLPDRKVAVLGAAGMVLSMSFVFLHWIFSI